MMPQTNLGLCALDRKARALQGKGPWVTRAQWDCENRGVANGSGQGSACRRAMANIVGMRKEVNRR